MFHLNAVRSVISGTVLTIPVCAAMIAIGHSIDGSSILLI